jgi:phage gp37-like protein
MSGLIDLREAIVAGIKAAVDSSLDVAAHSGRFTLDELSAFMVKAPAIRVAMLGVQAMTPVGEGGLDLDIQIGLYVATKDSGARLSRDTASLGLVEALVMLAHDRRWGVANAHPCQARTAQNLYTEAGRTKGVALWAIELSQTLRVCRDEALQSTALKELWVGFAPEIGSAHVNDYIHVETAPNVVP